MIEIYTDGACIGNPGPGGWAAVVVEEGRKRSISGGNDETTNNRMEITAIIEALKELPSRRSITVYSDSQYVVNTMKSQWKRKANLDLWQQLDEQSERHKVHWEWVKGHSGHPLNEEADSLAVSEAKDRAAYSYNNNLSHVDFSGKARMVDVGNKPVTDRVAVSKGSVRMNRKTLSLIQHNEVKKGDVLGVAMVAGILAAKNTPTIIPMCHSLPLDQTTIDFELDTECSEVKITATTKTSAKTGVEMEAMTAVTIAALTIYDMCKSVDRAMSIEKIRLVKKTGGRSGTIVLE